MSSRLNDFELMDRAPGQGLALQRLLKRASIAGEPGILSWSH